MNARPIRPGRFFYVCLLSFGLAACGGDDENTAPAPYVCTGSGSVTLSGKATYEFVPAVSNPARLAFNESSSRPIRRAEVVALCPDGSVTYGSATTNEQGEFSIEVPQSVDAVVRVRAVMQQSGSPSWDVSVVDNTRNQSPWAIEGEAFDTGTGDLTVNPHAASGWTGSGYTETRAAAPFAILESVLTAMQRVLEADAEANFPALKLNWSPTNSACGGTEYPFTDGCIGTSFYFNPGGSAGRNIFILGDAEGSDADTDEFDNHVVIHEWGHYYEDAFSRSDSIGGAHKGGDMLDARVAFGEGWGNAWSGIATDDPEYVDTFGTGSDGFMFDVESDLVQTGWWNEAAVQQIIYDLYDASSDGTDTLSLGFGPLHDAFTGGQRDTVALTTLFSFITALKGGIDVSTSDAIDSWLENTHWISTIGNEWGDNRTVTDDGGTYVTYLNDVFAETDMLIVPGLCTSNSELSSSAEHNRLGTRRFLRFTVPGEGTSQWTISLDSDLDDSTGQSDPDFIVYSRGAHVTSPQAGDPASGQDDSTTSAEGSGRIETATVTLVGGTQYVIEIFDWMNVDDDPSTGGDNVCLDLTFTQL